MTIRLTALSPEDAREALVTLRLLDDSEARQERCAEELAEVRAELRARQVVPVVVAEGSGPALDPVGAVVLPGGSVWATRLVWGLGGAAVGVLIGAVVVVWAG